MALDKIRNAMTQEFASRTNAEVFRYIGMLPNPDPVLRKLGYAIEKYRDLRSDAHVGACIISRKAGVRSLLWDIDRGRAQSRKAKFIKEIFESLDIDRIISDMLDAALYGYAPVEVIWESNGSAIIPADLVGKPPEWFFVDSDSKWMFRHASAPLTGIELPERKFLVVTNEATYGNPYGIGALSSCFWPVTFKRGGMQFWTTFAERYGMPHVIGKKQMLGNDAEDRRGIDHMREQLEQMVQDAVAVIPLGSEVDVLDVNKTASSEIYSTLVRFNNEEVSKAILGQTLTTQLDEKGGSRAAAQVHMDVRSEIVMSDERIVVKTFNKLIRWIIDLNFGSSTDYPKFVLFAEEDVDLATAQRDEIVSRFSGRRLSADYLSRTYGYQEGDLEEPTPAPVPPAPAPDSSPAAFSEFADGTRRAASAIGKIVQSQKRVDALADHFTPEELQSFAESALTPVIEMLRESADFSDAMERLAELFPAMNTEALQKTLQKAMYVAELEGRTSHV